MFNFLVFGMILWYQLVKSDTQSTTLSTPPSNDESSMRWIPETKEKYNFHAAQQSFYLDGYLTWKTQTDFSSNLRNTARVLDTGYIVTKGIGAHKLHVRRLPWNRARRICIEEGGHLAVIRTDSEEMILRTMMTDNSINYAWVGYHDKFEEGDWNSVLDEPLGQTGWSRWSKNISTNPNNFGGNQHCAHLYKDGGGLNDETCETDKSFICKISIS